MTQTSTVFHLSPANFCNILMTGAKINKERPQSLVTFETFDQSDEGTWPDQKKDNDKDKYKDKDNDKDKYI